MNLKITWFYKVDDGILSNVAYPFLNEKRAVSTPHGIPPIRAVITFLK
jgi:hypothetical protein